MRFQNLKQLWLFCYLFGEIMCRTTQYVVRPMHLYPDIGWVKYFMGVAPNFWAALSLPAALLLITNYVGNQYPAVRWIVPKDALHSSYAVALSGIVSWECCQPLTGMYYFDTNDLLWTIVGTAIFWPILRLLQARTLETAVTPFAAAAE
jgi:hypothetical protein